MKKLMFLLLIALIGCEKEADTIVTCPVELYRFHIGMPRNEVASIWGDTRDGLNTAVYRVLNPSGVHIMKVYYENNKVVAFQFYGDILPRDPYYNYQFQQEAELIYNFGTSKNIYWDEFDFGDPLDNYYNVGLDQRVVYASYECENVDIKLIGTTWVDNNYRTVMIQLCKNGYLIPN